MAEISDLSLELGHFVPHIFYFLRLIFFLLGYHVESSRSCIFQQLIINLILIQFDASFHLFGLVGQNGYLLHLLNQMFGNFNIFALDVSGLKFLHLPHQLYLLILLIFQFRLFLPKFQMHIADILRSSCRSNPTILNLFLQFLYLLGILFQKRIFGVLVDDRFVLDHFCS